jgi:hypothetical protein
MEEKRCALCNEKKELRQSHIIPKFVGKWLKDTSATGYLRQGVNPNLRQQDLSKKPLLCSYCEEKFSKIEKEFCENVFIPFQNGEKEFVYDKWLVDFVISLNWRIAYTELDHLGGEYLPDLLAMKNALETWRKYLNSESSNRGEYKHHIFFMDILESASDGAELVEKTNWYFLRSIDATISYNKENEFIYTKLPGMIFVSHIVPFNEKGWHNTRIENKGRLKIPQSCKVKGFGDFLIDRIKIANKLASNMSEVQREKIGKDMEKNFEKVMDSKSMQVMMADEVLKGMIKSKN